MVSWCLLRAVRSCVSWANDVVNRTQLCCGIQYGHDPVGRREEGHVGGHQEDKAHFCEVVNYLVYCIVVLRDDINILSAASVRILALCGVHCSYKAVRAKTTLHISWRRF
jgi:hypothetical protein